MENKWLKRRKRIFEIIEVGNDLDYPSRFYDFINVFAIVLNLGVSILYTFSDIVAKYGTLILIIEEITVAFFAVDYMLRVWTARFLHQDEEKFVQFVNMYFHLQDW